MQIVYITSSDSSSGGSRQALYLARGMHDRGHDVHFFAPATTTLKELDLVRGLNRTMLPAGNRQWKSVIEHALRPHTPAIVHAFHNKAVKMTAALGILWKLQHKPIVCIAHRGVMYPPRNPLPYLLPGIDCFAVNSQACLDTLPLLWRRKKAGKVIYNGIPTSKITPRRSAEDVRTEMEIPANAPIVGCVANNSSVKGLDILIRGFAKANIAGAWLVLVGVSNDIWRPVCVDAGISGRSRIVPPTEHVADYLQTFSLFVLPSRSESSPNTLLEAMRMGLPAVASNVGGIPECMPDTSLLFAREDSDGLAHILTRIMQDDALRESAGRTNREFSRRFTLEARLDAMEELYHSLLPAG